MAKHFQGRTDENGVPLTQWPAIQHEAAKYPHFTISVLNEDEAITDRQRRWYKGVCVRGLSEWNGESMDWWDYKIKIECGREIFNFMKLEYEGMVHWRPESISHKTKKQMTEFIENILSWAITENYPVYPPDPDLRRA